MMSIMRFLLRTTYHMSEKKWQLTDSACPSLIQQPALIVEHPVRDAYNRITAL